MARASADRPMCTAARAAGSSRRQSRLAPIRGARKSVAFRSVAKQIELLDHGARLRGSAHVHRRARGGIKQAPVAACADSWSEQIGRMLPVVAGPGCIAG